MGKFIDLTGQKFGKLTVLYRGEKAERGRSVKWYCLRARLQGEAKYYGLDAPQRHLFKQYGIEVDE